MQKNKLIPFCLLIVVSADASMTPELVHVKRLKASADAAAAQTGGVTLKRKKRTEGVNEPSS